MQTVTNLTSCQRSTELSASVNRLERPTARLLSEICTKPAVQTGHDRAFKHDVGLAMAVPVSPCASAPSVAVDRAADVSMQRCLHRLRSP